MLQPGISVVVPAFNEEDTIEEVVSQIFSVMESLEVPFEVIVVDDGSTDRTRERATKLGATVLSNGQNRGKGYALRKGFEKAQGEIIVTIDSDGSHDPKEILDLIKPVLNGEDVVAGSRFMGNGTHFTSRINRIGSFMMNMAIAILTGKRITDSQTGFRAFKSDFLKQVNLESSGFEIESEITVKALSNGFKFKEVPITCQPRMYNLSRVKILKDGIKIFHTILKANSAKITH